MTDIHDDLDAILEHHGIKGMKWGVRKEENSSSNSTSSTPSPKKPLSNTQKEQLKNLHENHLKFQAKFNPPGIHDLSDGQKRAAKIAAGAAATAIILGGGYYLGKNTEFGNSASQLFLRQTAEAQKISWTNNNYIQRNPHALTRPELHFPAGHEFSRISREAENSWSGATYAVTNKVDHDRYLGIGFGGTMDRSATAFKVTFKAKEPIRVPTLKTTLDTLKEVLAKENPNITDKQVSDHYNFMSGKQWNDRSSVEMFKKLQKKGYHAIVDDQDANVISDTPLVIFAHKAMGPKSNSMLTEDDMISAYANLKPLSHPVKIIHATNFEPALAGV